MVSINRKVLDLSHHNSVSSWQQVRGAGIVGIIHKATEGATYTDPDYLKRAHDAMNAGLLWGAYHWINAGNIANQVDNFLHFVGVDDETLYALDWEDDPNNGTASKAQAQEFLQRIAEKIGANRCVVYSGNTAKEKLGSNVDSFFGQHRLWLAQYGTSPVPQASWDDYWLWQYSDGNVGPQPHGCPGVSGDVDTNSWPGNDGQLRQEWSGAGVIPAPPTTQSHVDININIAGDVVVTVNGKPV